ncbi:MAG: hypothetical protein ABSH13_06235 [Candidatus Acidiferrum sp.]|jgi:hypothetical protein
MRIEPLFWNVLRGGAAWSLVGLGLTFLWECRKKTAGLGADWKGRMLHPAFLFFLEEKLEQGNREMGRVKTRTLEKRKGAAPRKRSADGSATRLSVRRIYITLSSSV